MSGGRIEIKGLVKVKPEQAMAARELFQTVIAQIRNDIISGTFGEFDDRLFSSGDEAKRFKARSSEYAHIADDFSAEALADGKLQFVLTLDAALFNDPNYCLQKLVHILVSDVFERQHDASLGQIEITNVDLGPIRPLVASAFRPQSNNIGKIKKALELATDEPLLAFSIKPRVGLPYGELLRVAKDVWDAGFQIVEMDTRDLEFSEPRMREFIELSKEGLRRSTVGKVRRFSVNCSGPQNIVAPLLRELATVHGDQPWVIKVDGNLEGLSLIQAIRRGEILASGQPQPIITCYPLLKYALGKYLGKNTLVEMLALSGADIIYPGQRPNLERTAGIDVQYTNRARQHYKAMDLGGYPMLSVAGGITAGQVHAFYTVLGANIAYFVGGGVALSPRGISQGAKTFKAALDLSRQESCKDEWEKSKLAEAFNKVLLPGFGEKDVVLKEFDYVNPVELQERGVVLTIAPKRT